MRTLADYTANDVAPEHQAPYAAHVEHWQAELHPNGALECYFAAEIVRAAWRMALYAATDADPGLSAEPKGLTDEARALRDRCRERTGLALRRNLEELRRIQSDRYLQSQTGILLPGVASLRLILPGLKQQKPPVEQAHTGEPNPEIAPTAHGKITPDPIAVTRAESRLHAHLQNEERRYLREHLNETVKHETAAAPKPAAPANAPRNAPCPCGSTKKYKHCCGHWSKITQPSQPNLS